MLNPSMTDLLRNVKNRYLLVNVTAQTARDIAQKAEDNMESLDEKAVTLAMREIAAGHVKIVPETTEEEPAEVVEEVKEAE